MYIDSQCAVDLNAHNGEYEFFYRSAMHLDFPEFEIDDLRRLGLDNWVYQGGSVFATLDETDTLNPENYLTLRLVHAPVP
jgi:hypothetical protein